MATSLGGKIVQKL